MRFLHTSDWHLGRTIRGRSRQPEFEKALDQVALIASEERVDAMIVAGDTFDAFSPPADAEKLLYGTIARIVSAGTRVVMVAGNHDSGPKMDAMAGILRMIGVYSIGSVPETMAQTVLRVPSRDGTEEATVVALPWVQERLAVDFATLSGAREAARLEYRENVGGIIRRACEAFAADTINIFTGHLLLEGSVVGEGSGERKLHIGHNFAVQPSCFPDTAQYVALGHIHKPQQIAGAAPLHYAGSLVQLDFGEGGQEKSVRIVEVKPRQPAHPAAVIPITAGRHLRTLRIKYDEIDAHRDKYGDDYLRVIVELDRPVLSLFEQVCEALPNTLEVKPERTDEQAPAERTARAGLAPHELFARYYREKHNAEIGATMLALFNELYEAESADATA